jgi:hypothetical protein
MMGAIIAAAYFLGHSNGYQRGVLHGAEEALTVQSSGTQKEDSSAMLEKALQTAATAAKVNPDSVSATNEVYNPTDRTVEVTFEDGELTHTVVVSRDCKTVLSHTSAPVQQQ